MKQIIAEHTTYDGIRDTRRTVTVYEEGYRLGHLYEVTIEDDRSFSSLAYDTMEEALGRAYEAVYPVAPTNGGVPAFDEA